MPQLSLEIVVGYVSAALVSLLNAPQAIKIYRMRSAAGLSAVSLGFHLASSLLWLWYGFLLQKSPIIFANSMYFLTNVTLIGFKLRFREPAGRTGEFAVARELRSEPFSGQVLKGTRLSCPNR